MAHATSVIFRHARIGRLHGMIGAEVAVVNYGTCPVLDLQVGIDLPGSGWAAVKSREDTLGPGAEMHAQDRGIAVDVGAWSEDNLGTVVLRFADMTGLL